MSDWIKLDAISHQVAIAGLVRNAQTRQGMPAVRVEIIGMPPAFKAKIDLLAELSGSDWENRQERLDRTQARYDGRFFFPDLPDGDYILKSSWLQGGTRYGTVNSNVAVSRDRHGKIAHNSLMIDLPPTSLTGKIADGNHKALVMAKVGLEGSSEYTFSDRDGNYSLIGVEASQSASQPRRVRASARGYKSQTTPIVLVRGQAKTADISLAIEN